jgi:hypothetical protein
MMNNKRRRGGGNPMSEKGRTAAARLVHLWQGLERERECHGRVLVHLDGAVTCGGKCEDVEKVYHAARPAPCRGKRAPANGACARCTGRPELDLSSLVGTAMTLMRMSDGLHQMLAAARSPEGAVPGVRDEIACLSYAISREGRACRRQPGRPAAPTPEA